MYTPYCPNTFDHAYNITHDPTTVLHVKTIVTIGSVIIVVTIFILKISEH